MSLDDFAIKGSHFGFSAARIADLGAAEYTLVGIAADASPSVSAFRGEIERCIAEIVRACRASPRADNLMLRLTAFESAVSEIHGFKPLAECHTASYAGCLPNGGGTALYDGAHNGAAALAGYGKHLSDNDFAVNGILFVITDGEDNSSRVGPAELCQALADAVKSETLESLTSVLVGVNITDANMARYLARLHHDAGFSKYVELGDAHADTLAKLADFVSRSIGAQSRALGSGRPSASLSF